MGGSLWEYRKVEGWFLLKLTFCSDSMPWASQSEQEFLSIWEMDKNHHIKSSIQMSTG